LGGIDLPAIGFALGIDRLANYCEANRLLKIDKKLDIFFMFSNFVDYPNVLK
jgi:histidyl-tRNA synthetase